MTGVDASTSSSHCPAEGYSHTSRRQRKLSPVPTASCQVVAHADENHDQPASTECPRRAEKESGRETAPNPCSSSGGGRSPATTVAAQPTPRTGEAPRYPSGRGIPSRALFPPPPPGLATASPGDEPRRSTRHSCGRVGGKSSREHVGEGGSRVRSQEMGEAWFGREALSSGYITDSLGAACRGRKLSRQGAFPSRG